MTCSNLVHGAGIHKLLHTCSITISPANDLVKATKGFRLASTIISSHSLRDSGIGGGPGGGGGAAGAAARVEGAC